MINPSKMEFYRHRNEQSYDTYDDDFRGYSKEIEESKRQEKEDAYAKEMRREKSFWNFILRKLSNGQNNM